MKKLIYSLSMMLLLAIAAFGQNSASDWTDPNYRFEIKYTIGGKLHRAKVQEITGLDEVVFSTDPKRPGVRGGDSVALKKVVFTSKHSTNPLLSNSTTTGPNIDVIIRLVDEAGKTAMVWILRGAYLNRSVGNPNQDKNSFNTIELAYKRIELIDITEFDEQNGI